MSAGRVPVNVSNAWDTTEWLRMNIGADMLSGYFARGDTIVFTPREGAPGYIPPPVGSLDHHGPAQVRIADAGHIAATITETMWPFRFNKDREPVACRFPSSSAGDVIKRLDLAPGLRILRGVSHTPFARADGSIVDTPGYDGASGYLYLPETALSVLPVASTPTAADVAVAAALLTSMLDGFPWVCAGDRANYIGAMLTPLLREIVPPPYKIAIFTAPQRGSGKSYLASGLRILHGGVIRGEAPRNEEEMRKAITSVLTSTTAPVVIFDNVKGLFGAPALDMLLTSDSWSDRVLGASQEITVPNDRFWVITGNNVTIGGDLSRRSLWISIDANMPNPESRTGFAIGDYLAYVTAHRGQILHALLTIIRSWAVAGMPVVPAVRSDQYALWTQVVGGILAHAGIPGGFDSAETTQAAASTEDDEWHDLLATIYAIKGSEPWTAREMLEYRISEPIDPSNVMLGVRAHHPVIEALPSALAEKMRGGDPSTIAKSFGTWLRHRDGRWAERFAARRAGEDTHRRGLQWKVDCADDVCGSAGLAGLTPTHKSSQFFEMSEMSTKSTPAGPGVKPARPADPQMNGHRLSALDILMEDAS